jgi:DNA-binding HxlR family transcriptional regulator
MIPLCLDQAVTPLGETLREPLRALTEWSTRHAAEVLAAREEYDTSAERGR